jgi:hypothetical protein
MKTRGKLSRRALGALTTVLFASRLAWADPEPVEVIAAAEPARASSGVESGALAPVWARAYAQGHWSLAADLIETVPAPSRTPWHWLDLARAREQGGQLVEALFAYERLREMAPLKEAGIDQRIGRLQAEAEREALVSRIAWAQIELGVEAAAGGDVFVDQELLAPARVQSPDALNPGWHTFLLESQGVVVAAHRVYFEEGQRRPVVLQRLPVTPGALAPRAEGTDCAAPLDLSAAALAGRY